MKIELSVLKCHVKTYFLCPYEHAGYIPARVGVVGIAFPFQLRKAYQGINADHTEFGWKAAGTAVSPL